MEGSLHVLARLHLNAIASLDKVSISTTSYMMLETSVNKLQILQHFAITPSVQQLINPELEETRDQIWLFGIRVRLNF